MAKSTTPQQQVEQHEPADQPVRSARASRVGGAVLREGPSPGRRGVSIGHGPILKPEAGAGPAGSLPSPPDPRKNLASPCRSVLRPPGASLYYAGGSNGFMGICPGRRFAGLWAISARKEGKHE